MLARLGRYLGDRGGQRRQEDHLARWHLRADLAGHGEQLDRGLVEQCHGSVDRVVGERHVLRCHGLVVGQLCQQQRIRGGGDGCVRVECRLIALAHCSAERRLGVAERLLAGQQIVAQHSDLRSGEIDAGVRVDRAGRRRGVAGRLGRITSRARDVSGRRGSDNGGARVSVAPRGRCLRGRYRIAGRLQRLLLADELGTAEGLASAGSLLAGPGDALLCICHRLLGGSQALALLVGGTLALVPLGGVQLVDRGLRGVVVHAVDRARIEPEAKQRFLQLLHIRSRGAGFEGPIGGKCTGEDEHGATRHLERNVAFMELAIELGHLRDHLRGAGAGANGAGESQRGGFVELHLAVGDQPRHERPPLDGHRDP